MDLLSCNPFPFQVTLNRDKIYRIFPALNINQIHKKGLNLVTRLSHLSKNIMTWLVSVQPHSLCWDRRKNYTNPDCIFQIFFYLNILWKSVCCLYERLTIIKRKPMEKWLGMMKLLMQWKSQNSSINNH